MKKNIFLAFFLTLSLLFLFGCSTDEILQNEELQISDSEIEVLSKNNTKGIIHHISLGGNDICEALGDNPGCDKNYSLVANMHADGTVKGQLIDMWPDKIGGIHVDINCMFVEGNMASVSGIVKRGRQGDFDLTGWNMIAFMIDNGTSNNETPDQVSFAFFNSSFDYCDILEGIPFDSPNIIYVDILKGQVKIW